MAVDEEPLNREPKTGDLISTFITEHGGYDRNHGPVPHLSAASHKVTLDGAVARPTALSLDQLRNDFPQHSILSALQCAGNRRHEMRTKISEVQGIDWNDAAVLNAQWRGPRLCDILDHVGIDLEDSVNWRDNAAAAHVQFACYQQPTQEDGWYGGSIPLARAMREDADVILALEMNGKELTPEHGFPVRVVVPGVAGARSVKWLDRITVATTESSNFYQQHDYKILPPEAKDTESADKFWKVTPALTDMPVNSIVGSPASSSTVRLRGDGTVEAKGYALPSGEEGPIVKVEVSGDEGSTWTEAELDWGGWDRKHGESLTLKWAWCLWHANVPIKKGAGRRIWSRATDASGNVQPREGKWTLRGVAYNAYGEAQDLEIV